jgi:hypothetical protein
VNCGGCTELAEELKCRPNYERRCLKIVDFKVKTLNFSTSTEENKDNLQPE